VARRQVVMNEIVEMIFQWHQGNGVKGISHSLGFDRDTVRKYVRMAQKVGVERSKPLPEPGELISKLKGLRGSTPHERPQSKI